MTPKINEFLNTHIGELCADLHQQYETCILPDGRVKELRELVREFTQGSGNDVAAITDSLIKRAAIQIIANNYRGSQ